MKRFFLLILFAGVFCLASLSQNAQAGQRASNPADSAQTAGRAATGYEFVTVNLSLVPGVSIGDIIKEQTGKKIINRFSYNFIGGSAERLDGIEFSNIFGVYTEEARGAQLSGVVNIVGGSLTGFQGAGVASVIGGDARGCQASGVANVAGGGVWGLQASGVANVSGQALEGAQAAGVFNMTGSAAWGLQAAGVANIAAKDFDGLQVAGVVNITGGRHAGLQVGTVNIAGAMDGVHVGVVNIADSGNGAPIGLFSFVKGAGVKLDLWGDEMGFLHTTLRTGTRSFANYFGFAWRPQDVSQAFSMPAYAGVLYGLGGEFSFGENLYGTVDLMGMTVKKTPFVISWDANRDNWRETAQILKLRLTAGVKIFPGFALFGGAALNSFTSRETAGDELVRWSFVDAQIGSTVWRFSPGILAGIRLF